MGGDEIRAQPVGQGGERGFHNNGSRRRFQQHHMPPGFQIENAVLVHPALLPVHLQHQVAAGPPDALQGQVQQGKEIFLCYRLHDVAQGGNLIALKDVVRIIGEEGQRYPDICLPDLPCQIQAAEFPATQVNIQQNQVKRIAVCRFKEQFLAAGKGTDIAELTAFHAPTFGTLFHPRRHSALIIANGNVHRSGSFPVE